MRRTLITLLSVTAFALLALGIIVLSSASSEQSVRLFDNPHELLVKQLVWVCFGFVLAFFAQRFDYHYFKLTCASFKFGRYRFSQVPVLTITLYLVIIVALILVYVPGIGLKINGSSRWLDLHYFRLQPSEFAKIAMVVAMSVWLDRIGSKAKCFVRGSGFSFLILVPVAGLIICQSDLGATMVISLLAVTLMIVAGVNLKHLLPISLVGTVAGIVYVCSSPNRLARLKAWWAGVNSSMEQADQLRESILAIQRGGLTGVGYTHSLQKYRYLPESHTDFVFPIGAEEFGLIFSLSVVILFLIILICGVLISCKAPDKLGRYMALGLTVLIVFPGMFNLMVVTGLVPTKGIALPFFSYGGTSIISIMIAVGMLINVARHIGACSEQTHTRLERNAINEI